MSKLKTGILRHHKTDKSAKNNNSKLARFLQLVQKIPDICKFGKTCHQIKQISLDFRNKIVYGTKNPSVMEK